MTQDTKLVSMTVPTFLTTFSRGLQYADAVYVLKETRLCQRVLQMDTVSSKCVMDISLDELLCCCGHWCCSMSSKPSAEAVVVQSAFATVAEGTKARENQNMTDSSDTPTLRLSFPLRDPRTLKSLSAPQPHLIWQRLPWRCCASPGGQLV